MSFDVFLEHLEESGGAPVDPAPVREIIEDLNYEIDEVVDFYLIRFADGTGVELGISGLDGSQDFTGCAFFIRTWGPEIPDLIYRVARAGDLVIFAAMANSVPVVVHRHQVDILKKLGVFEGATPLFVQSGAELGAFLTNGYDGWKGYRDQVVGDSENSE
ncbi:MAG: hypothetical protein H6817_09840 [Phycisphaerales bacterium]|nr:hypothetical protein [Phycisphaerales bacterium]